jgi:hypothetical protein
VVSNDKKYYLSWMVANDALDSFLTCRVTVLRDGATLQGANSVFVSHEFPLVRLAITGVPIDASVQPGSSAVCAYTANGDNSVVSFAWSVAARSTGEGDMPLGAGRTFAFTTENLALLKNQYLICRAHSGVSPYYLDSIASVSIADRPAFRPADPVKAIVASAALPAFDLSTYLQNGNVSLGALANTTVNPGQVVTSQITITADAGIKRMEEKVYDAKGRLVTVVAMTSKDNGDGSLTWSTSWMVPKATTIYVTGGWPIKVVATRAADLQSSPPVIVANVQVAGIVSRKVDHP